MTALWIALALVGGAALAWFLNEKRHRRAHPVEGGYRADLQLPHRAPWALYHNSFSLCSKKLRICMHELGLAYESHPVELVETGGYETLSRAFLAVNPAGTVPVLLHEGHPIYESHEQIVYAARHAGEAGRRLLPEDRAAAAEVQCWIDRASLTMTKPGEGMKESAGNCIPGLTLPLFTTMLRTIPLRRFAEGLLFHHDKARPVFLSLLKLRGIRGFPSLAPALRMHARSREQMGRHLDELGAQLEKTGGPWLAGDTYTLADVSWVVVLDRIAEVGLDVHFWGDGRRPGVAAYWERLTARESYREAVLDARCQHLLRGMDELRSAMREDATLRLALEGA